MKLDHNCVRDVLLFLEKAPYITINADDDIEFSAVCLDEIYTAIPKYPNEMIFYTLFELNDGGYINIDTFGGDDVITNCCVNYITYAGHEFLEKIRPDSIWKQTLNIACKVGNFGIPLLGKIAESLTAICVEKLLSGN